MANENSENTSLSKEVEAEQVASVETVQTEQLNQKQKAKSVTTSKKTDKKQKQNKEKSPNRLAKKFKETTSELKKVSWSSFGQVVKKTSIVLSVVLIFAVVLFGIDRLLSWLFSLLIGG